MGLRRLLTLVLTAALLAGAAGCGSDRDKGTNRGLDKPASTGK
jgi:hypothetical protein